MKKLFIVFCLWILAFGGAAVAQNNSDKDHNFKVAKNLETFSAIYKFFFFPTSVFDMKSLYFL